MLPITGVPYPVDCPDEDYSHLSDDVMPCLNNSFLKKSLILPHGLKVDVCRENIARLSLFSGDVAHSVFALHLPGNESQVVAVYLHGEWWSLHDIMKTSCKSRCGLVVVNSIMERVVLFLMSQIIFGILERSLDEEMYFSPHALEEFGKILWQDGEAVGFYTVKRKGTLCSRCSGQTYALPVLDTLFVRTPWRRKGLASEMLRDFCSSFSQEEALGVSHPISARMDAVCRKFLELHEEERERLYEVEGAGAWGQRRNVWLGLQLRQLAKHRQSPQIINPDKGNTDKEDRNVPPLSADRVLPVQRTQTSPGGHSEVGGLPTSTTATAVNPKRSSGRKQHANYTEECASTKRRKRL
ncbi:hypothetical protein ACEWY4_011401 [Coilia grayii]|uniref:Protein FAM169B n=1 Tax=Coilia grayii TaxID=363190 RepID=A0ABD1K4N6_9TELE